MRSQVLGLMLGAAILSVAALPSADAAQLGGHRGFAASRAPMMRGPSVGIQRWQRFQNLNRIPTNRLLSRGHHRSKTGVSVVDQGPGATRVPPHRRPPHGHRPPWHRPGIAIGPGVIIGTGVAIGVAGASPLPPPPPTGIGNPPASFSGPPGGRINIPPGNEQRFVKDEVVLEFAGNIPTAAVAQLLARHGMQQLEAQSLQLTNTIFVRARIINRRAVRTALRGLGGEAILSFGQPNYLYRSSQDQGFASSGNRTPRPTPVVASAAALPGTGDPAQYALAKLRLNEAHRLATGDKILVAVIDSGVDAGHPELRGVIAETFDALGKTEKPHMHGTAIAGAIAAHARLLGAAPSARILAIRAFGAAGTSAEATSFAILKGIDHAAIRHARVINMSFAGPLDPALSRHLAAAKAGGAVLIAASGNFGPKSPPQYPAADPNVIAVSATDADDKLFKAANIGRHIAVTAPGVGILLPVPDNNYKVLSGTSFAAAEVSGIAALVLERKPDLTPDAMRELLTSTAHDLGPHGKDEMFGAGLANAYAAITALRAPTGVAQDQPIQPTALPVSSPR